MNEEAAKAAIEKMQHQVEYSQSGQFDMDWANWDDQEGVLLTGNEAKALIELWNFYQMYKPR